MTSRGVGWLFMGVVVIALWPSSANSSSADSEYSIRGGCWIEKPTTWESAPPELGYRSDNAKVAILVLAQDGSCALLDSIVIRTDETTYISEGDGLAAYLGVVDASSENPQIQLRREFTTGYARMLDGNFLPPRFPPSLKVTISPQSVALGDHIFVPLTSTQRDLQEQFVEILTRLSGVEVNCGAPAPEPKK